MKKPYVGAVVHYRYRENDAVRAALVTRVHDDVWVSLYIFEPGGMHRSASHVEYGLARGWKWIPDPDPPKQYTYCVGEDDPS